jgi:glyoxylase-like metal-dependent hydrolase (beta-lactamase superfamily II)
MKIIDNVFVVPGVVANIYILVDDDGLTIIDAGLPRSEKKILAYVAGLGKSARDVKRIILTHSDLDRSKPMLSRRVNPHGRSIQPVFRCGVSSSH